MFERNGSRRLLAGNWKRLQENLVLKIQIFALRIGQWAGKELDRSRVYACVFPNRA